MDREDQLVNALMHIAKVAHNSRTKTKRLAFIEKRALDAVDGVEYNRDEFVLPVMDTLTPLQYDHKIRELKREIREYKEMSFVQRIVWAFKGEKNV